MSKVSDEILDAGRETFRKNACLNLDDRLCLAYAAAALAERKRIFGVAEPLIGFLDFCEQFPGGVMIEKKIEGLGLGGTRLEVYRALARALSERGA